jgi:acyl-ACP thioesterase
VTKLRVNFAARLNYCVRTHVNNACIAGTVPINLCICALKKTNIFRRKMQNKSTTANGGSLGSLFDEEHSQL